MVTTYDVDSEVLALVGELMGVHDPGELADSLNRVLRRHVPSDWVSVNDVGADPHGRIAAVVDPPVLGEMFKRYTEHAHQNPLLAHYLATGDGRPTRFSDVTTTRKLRATELYRRVYGPLGVNHQMAFMLPATPGRVLAVALSREASDFSDRERAVVDRARPYLIQIWRTALAFRDGRAAGASPVRGLRARGLTARQAEVVAAIARGSSDAAVAQALGIAERTVGKHAERAYRVLGVRSRSEASALAWDTAAEVALPDGDRGDGPSSWHARDGA